MKWRLFLLIACVEICGMQKGSSMPSGRAEEKIECEGMGVSFQKEGNRGVLTVTSLNPGREYHLGFSSSSAKGAVVADDTGTIEVVVFRQDKEKSRESLSIESGDFRRVFTLDW